MNYSLITEKGGYALILRGKSMTEYAVVEGLDKESGSWAWTCSYYNFGKYANLTKAEALFHALDYFRMRTEDAYIPYGRMSEIATRLKDGLVEDDKEEAYRYMADNIELSETEIEYFGLEKKLFDALENGDFCYPAAPSSTDGDYSPSAPWNALGMSPSDFI